MKNVLVLVEDYPTSTSQSLMYVHERNKSYLNYDINVDVLNFRANENYVYENVNVITYDEYKNENKKYDILICHAANIKHHYVFLKKYSKDFNKIIFFYHGHEIVKINENYPKDYSWKKTSKIKYLLRSIYDNMKLFLWKKQLKKVINKSYLIFVSRWLYERFLYYVHINPKLLFNKVSIINNSVGKIFQTENYDFKSEKKYDFITIRGSALDNSEKGIDVVYNLAKANPKMKFLIIGKGKFFEYNKMLENITLISESLTHDKMIKYLNKSRCALMPTKHDTQGVMTCEIATFGIPTITSNIEVCKEIFSEFENVSLIDNDNDNIDLKKVLSDLENKIPYKKNYKYFFDNTVAKEIEIIKSERA